LPASIRALHKLFLKPFISSSDSPWTLALQTTMKLFILVALLGSPLTIGALLGARQAENCNFDDCYRAVWPGNDPDMVDPRSLLACARHLTTTQILFPL
jgi:hypothetical protein